MQPFEDVVAEHGPVVLRVCRAMLGHADADDAWAETFLAALKAYPDLRPDSNVRAWLVTIAHRKAIDQTRSRARRPLPVADLPETPSTIGVPADPDTELWAAFQALPLKQRGAVAYHHLAGMPYSEVAALLDSSEAAARRSAADGIAGLRRSYPKGIPDDEHERQ
ncbi:MAG TPA: sigma-70 family RNA polymerase sigma factor [Ilumatobacteraceae bacterium]|nr:sigma-70 family RNA polymerase sigma factor [Ilumatobacteraceae bacterium]